MTIQIQRGRQFLGGTEATPLFDERGQRGGWLKAAADKLVTQKVELTLTDKRTGQAVSLDSAAAWDNFLSANVSSQAATRAFATRFGITFQDFVELVDDAASSADTGLTLDLSPTSELSKALSLDTMSNDYGTKVTPGASISLGATGTAQAASTNTIGAEILANPVGGDWDRDRTEQESWADFELRDGATRIFRDNTGPAPFAKLTDPKWDDPESMKLVNDFALPLHVERDTTTPTNPDGTPNLQDHNEMFRETYFDDANGSLKKAGASVRARVRFDDDAPFTVRRVLVQAKEGREVDPLTGRSAVHKFEKRWEGTSQTEEGAQKALVTGKDGSSVMPVSQKLYKLLKDTGNLPADGQLTLSPQHLVLQRRRRTHLQMDSVSTVNSRLSTAKAELDKQKAAGSVKPELEAFVAKLEKQVALMNDMSTLLRKYGSSMPSGETFIVSADRYNVYDPASRTAPPNDIDDEAGRAGRGLHVEAEWDTASSEPFEKAIESIDTKLAANPSNRAELEADKAKLEGFREVFRGDVAKTVAISQERLTDAGLRLDPAKKSKDERAADIMAAARNRPVFWV